ncbi:uncharacterized protein LOC126896261 isoform X2 [Daktulosphaira vitifoliae]|uniref:uncharacterized protein LOC126896261 isoform X2 n=1 Tax=Daktulosphaira vitifoliae TaxID=58002 RepID=UPI0021AA1579|nr:uncharacterized protein LOC126896261 isoform X2 [Daktulosphaira vitifoliae]
MQFYIVLFVYVYVLLSSVISYDLADLTLVGLASNPNVVPEGYENNYEKCLAKRKVLFGNTCWDLLTKGPCHKGQWLVINPDGLDDTNQPIKAQCVRRRCSEGDVYWPLDGFCHRMNESSRQLCPNQNTRLAVDAYGEGYCRCSDNMAMRYARVDEQLNTACYPVYTQGPCRLGYVVTETQGPGFGNCTVDTCISLTRWRWAPISLNSSQAPWTNRRCYELYTNGPCPNNEQFTVLPDSRKPGYSQRQAPVNLLSSMPTRCDMDNNGESVDAVQLSNTTTADYTAQLLISAI